MEDSWSDPPSPVSPIQSADSVRWNLTSIYAKMRPSSCEEQKARNSAVGYFAWGKDDPVNPDPRTHNNSFEHPRSSKTGPERVISYIQNVAAVTVPDALSCSSSRKKMRRRSREMKVF